MTNVAQNVTFSFAPQAAGKIGAGGSFTPGSYNWRRHKTTQFEGGTQSVDELFPLELGGSITPTGAYRRGNFYAAQIGLIPRLSGSLGWLLLAAMGNVSSVSSLPVASTYTHVFRHNPSNAIDVPWLASRILIPGDVSAEDFVEYGYDCRLGGLRIAVPNAGKLEAQIQLIGRDSQFASNPGSLTYANSFEGSGSTPDAGNGSFSIGGNAIPAIGADVMINNTMTRVQDEYILGSMNPDDFKPVNRAVQVRYAHKYNNSQEYQRTMSTSPSGTDWSPTPRIVDTAGQNYAIDMVFRSPEYITGSTPYTFRLRGNRVVIQPEGSPRLVGGQMIVQNYVATLMEPASGDYVQIIIENGQSGYLWN